MRKSVCQPLLDELRRGIELDGEGAWDHRTFGQIQLGFCLARTEWEDFGPLSGLDLIHLLVTRGTRLVNPEGHVDICWVGGSLKALGKNNN